MNEESKRGDVKPDQGVPDTHSSQNAEEPPAPGGSGERREASDKADDDERPSGGESSEGSQSTGNPAGAG
ncbi:MAG: hypothetical protein M3016_05795 [Actinomycetota bacterium]|nr:hypothetical protein [Actinomycetota bacterium]